MKQNGFEEHQTTNTSFDKELQDGVKQELQDIFSSTVVWVIFCLIFAFFATRNILIINERGMSPIHLFRTIFHLGGLTLSIVTIVKKSGKQTNH